VRFKVTAICVAALLAFAAPGESYAIFTHQELIDLAWEGSIRPVLLQRYPGLTKLQLENARAYAYGGSVIQDMGYYPVGHRFFSDLTHYVRTGDFVTALFRTARNANELAFAIGALSHYVGDSIGHSEAVNPSVGSTFPDLVRKYGHVVTYEDNPVDHVRVEFGFDVAQIAKHRYTPAEFRRHIGFRVADQALDRALLATYGVGLREALGHVRPGAESYRFSVHKLMPLYAHTEVVRIRGRLNQEIDDEPMQQYLAALGGLAREHQWADEYRSPGVKAHFLALLVDVLPPIGVLRALDTKAPTAKTEDLFVRSVGDASGDLSADLARYAAAPGRFRLRNLDLDTGYPVAPGMYRLTDQTYALLVARLACKPTQALPPGMLEDIVAYYSDPNAPITTKAKPAAWKQVQHNLAILNSRGAPAASN
jgi:hypothetical protein